jgi:hypothetical protein
MGELHRWVFASATALPLGALMIAACGSNASNVATLDELTARFAIAEVRLDGGVGADYESVDAHVAFSSPAISLDTGCGPIVTRFELNRDGILTLEDEQTPSWDGCPRAGTARAVYQLFSSSPTVVVLEDQPQVELEVRSGDGSVHLVEADDD